MSIDVALGVGAGDPQGVVPLPGHEQWTGPLEVRAEPDGLQQGLDAMAIEVERETPT